MDKCLPSVAAASLSDSLLWFLKANIAFASTHAGLEQEIKKRRCKEIDSKFQQPQEMLVMKSKLKQCDKIGIYECRNGE